MTTAHAPQRRLARALRGATVGWSPVPRRPPQLPESGRARTARLRLRRRLVLWSLPAVVVLGLLAAKLVTMVAWGEQALAAYTAGNITGTQDMASRLGFLNVLERHKAPFARGDARVLAGDYDGARAAFEEALALAPAGSRDGCQIRVNLALTLEKLAQSAQSGGRVAESTALLERIRQLVSEAPPQCFSDDTQEEGQRLRDSQQRADEQLRGLQHGPQSTPGQQSGQPTQPEADRQRQLDEKTRDNLEQRQQGDQQYGSMQRPPVDKPW